MLSTIYDKNRLQKLFIEKVNQSPSSETKIKGYVSYLLILLEDHYSDLLEKRKDYVKQQIKGCFSRNEYLKVFGFYKDENGVFKELDVEVENISDRVDDCIISTISITRFYEELVSDIKGISLDFFSLYVGYAGWEGFQKGVSIQKCFFIPDDNINYIEYDIDGYDFNIEKKKLEKNQRPKAHMPISGLRIWENTESKYNFIEIQELIQELINEDSEMLIMKKSLLTFCKKGDYKKAIEVFNEIMNISKDYKYAYLLGRLEHLILN